MIIKPEKVSFETPEDIIDYVSKGLVPTKKNYLKLKEAIKISKEPVEDFDEDYDYWDDDIMEDIIPEKDVIIPKSIMMNISDETFNRVLDRTYKNRVRNRNVIIGMIGTLAIGALISSNGKSSKNKENINTED